VIVGTSSPIITDILYGKKSAVDISYYVTTMLPLGIIIGLLAGIGQLLWWTRTDKESLWKILRLPAIVALVIVAGLVPFGLGEPLVALFVYAAAFALAANIQVAWRIFSGNPKFAGGSIAHIGIAVMFFGFVASSKYDEKLTISLAQGKPVEALGYRLTYMGYKPLDNERYAFNVRVEKEGKSHNVAPIMYYSSYNDGLMRNPDIANFITRDFYLAPLSLEQKTDDAPQKVEFKRGETKDFEGLQVTFVDFDFPVEGKEVRIGAKLRVKEESGKTLLLTPAKVMNSGGQPRDDAATLEGMYEFTITGMRPDREAKENSRVEIGMRDLRQKASTDGGQGDVLVAEASVKPYINLVWAGVIILLVGFLVTIVRRAQEASLRTAESDS
jgi:cytochrome c-type biogenesis protein CcmF